ncbi:MAG: hypothetical protein IJ668_00270 [Selenomonadaceae bacterium]|nr:hypothetical protein [Selenomonadaceae bacterium]
MKLTEGQLTKARACKSAEELRSLAASEGIELNDEEAEAYFAELNDVHVSDEELDAVAGGKCTNQNCGNPFEIKHPDLLG